MRNISCPVNHLADPYTSDIIASDIILTVIRRKAIVQDGGNKEMIGSNIKNIVFDMGRVLLDYDPALVARHAGASEEETALI